MIELAMWFDNIGSAFKNSSCMDNYKVEFATSMFRDAAQTWWSEHAKTVGTVAANSIPWEILKILMVEEYCPKSVKRMLEQEFGNLTMKGYEIGAYITRFNELAALCPEMVTPEHRKIKRYIQGLTPQIKEAVTVFLPTTFENIKRITVLLTSQRDYQETTDQRADPPRSSNDNNKRKTWDKNQNRSKQNPPKRRKIVAVFTAIPAEVPTIQKPYLGNLPKCDECPFYHSGPCRELICNNCKKKGHTTRFCRNPAQKQISTAKAGASRSCYGCGKQGHFKRECQQARGPE